jgi:hypothetical protein
MTMGGILAATTMPTIECPSCQARIDAEPARSSVRCPACGRVAAVPGAAPASDAGGPETEAYVEPLAPAEEPTAVGAARAVLALPAGKRVSVAILSGERKGDVVVLDRPSLSLGRQGGGADVQVADPDVSRSHAALDCHGARIVLRDVGSRNGTFVGEARITSLDVEDRTEFRLGGTRFMLLVTDLD